MSRRTYRLVLVLAAALAGLALSVVPAGLIYNNNAERRSVAQYPQPARTITVNGVRVHYLCEGDSDPPLVLLHAAPGSLVDWTPVFTLLSERNRVCALDTPGYGWSDPLAGASGLEAQATHLRTTLAALDIRRPVLVGHSLGGALALTAAAAEPRGFRGLALLDPTTPFIAESVRGDLGSLARLRLLLPLGISHLVESNAAEGLQRQRPSGSNDVSRGLAGQIASVNARTAVVDTLARNGSAIADDLAALESKLGTVTTPTLVLAPSEQPPGLRAALDRLAQTLPDARIKQIEDSRHYLHLAQPAAVTAAIREFMAER